MDRLESPARARRLLWVALGVCAFSLALRLTWACFAQITPVSDFHGYDMFAVRWIENGTFGWKERMAYRTPGYPGFLALVYLAFGHSWKAASVVQACLGGLTSGGLVLLAGRVTSARSSAIAGLCHALSPTAVAYIPVLASENLAVPLVVFSVLILAWSEAGNRWSRATLAGCAGLGFGLLLLVRPAALFFCPALLLLAAYSFRRSEWRLVPPLVFIVAAALIVAPWLVRNHRVGLGAATLSTSGGINLWMGNNDLAVHGGYCREAAWPGDRPEGEADRAYAAAARAWIRNHPGRYAALCGTRLRRIIGTEPDVWVTKYFWPTAESDEAQRALHRFARSPDPELETLVQRARQAHGRNLKYLKRYRRVVAPLMVVALLLSLARWRAYVFVSLPVACYLGCLAATFFQPRFRELSDPLLFVPVAALLADVIWGTHDLGRRPNRWMKLALLAVALGLTYAFS